jgi:hypothetical protein
MDAIYFLLLFLLMMIIIFICIAAAIKTIINLNRKSTLLNIAALCLITPSSGICLFGLGLSFMGIPPRLGEQGINAGFAAIASILLLLAYSLYCTWWLAIRQPKLFNEIPTSIKLGIAIGAIAAIKLMPPFETSNISL